MNKVKSIKRKAGPKPAGLQKAPCTRVGDGVEAGLAEEIGLMDEEV